MATELGSWFSAITEKPEITGILAPGMSQRDAPIVLISSDMGRERFAIETADSMSGPEPQMSGRIFLNRSDLIFAQAIGHRVVRKLEPIPTAHALMWLPNQKRPWLSSKIERIPEVNRRNTFDGFASVTVSSDWSIRISRPFPSDAP